MLSLLKHRAHAHDAVEIGEWFIAMNRYKRREDGNQDDSKTTDGNANLTCKDEDSGGSAASATPPFIDNCASIFRGQRFFTPVPFRVRNTSSLPGAAGSCAGGA